MRRALVTGGAADEAHPLEVLAARLGHRRQEPVEVRALVRSDPMAVAVLAALAERRRGVLSDVLAALTGQRA